MIYEVRTRFDVDPEAGDELGSELIANVVAKAIRRELEAEALHPAQG